MLISEIFKPENIILNLKSTTKEELFDELADHLINKKSFFRKDEIIMKLRERENKMTTGIAPNIGIPHISIKNLQKTTGILGISYKGIEYDSLDGKPVHLVFLLIGVEGNPAEHLSVLKNIAMLLKNNQFYADIIGAKNPDETFSIINAYEKKI